MLQYIKLLAGNSNANNIYICELHFKQECILTGGGAYFLWKRIHIGLQMSVII
jgi:hypothetical protein